MTATLHCESISDIRAMYAERAGGWLDANPVRVSVRGRVISKRVMGKASFAEIDDGSGEMVLYLEYAILGPQYDPFASFDIGDILGGTGRLLQTESRALWVKATAVTVGRDR